MSYDALIVGAGAAGLSAAIYTSRGNFKTAILGNIYESQIAKSGNIENYPGFPNGIQGLDLIVQMWEQAERYGTVNFSEKVSAISILKKGFTAEMEDEVVEGRTIILCSGARHRKLGIPGEDEFFQNGVSYCAYCDGALYRDRRVAVAGYGNGAAKAALTLQKLCRKVTILCTTDTLDAEAVYLDRIEDAGNIDTVTDTRDLSISGRERVEKVMYSAGDRHEWVEVDAVFIENGVEPNSALARELGLELTGRNYVKVKRPSQETGVQGVFAAGDITGGRLQISSAVGEGASAAISAMRYLSKNL